MEVIGSAGESKDIGPKEAVLVTFEGRMANDRSITNGPLFQKAESWLIVVAESDVVAALDMVRSARRKKRRFLPWRVELHCDI